VDTVQDNYYTSESDQRGPVDKYLTFALGDNKYGINILKASCIQEFGKSTPLPQAPDYILGIINLRGDMVPLIDLRRRFGMKLIKHTSANDVIVVRIASGEAETTVGLVVDAVSEVNDVSEKECKPPPSFGNGLSTAYIKGVATVNESMLILLDVDLLMDPGGMKVIDAIPSDEL